VDGDALGMDCVEGRGNCRSILRMERMGSVVRRIGHWLFWMEGLNAGLNGSDGAFISGVVVVVVVVDGGGGCGWCGEVV